MAADRGKKDPVGDDSRPGTGDSVRERVQAAALECFEVTGYEGTTMAQIARRAGISPAALYLHFPGKRELFESLNRPDLDFPPIRLTERRQEILGAALKIFAEKGYAGATMDDVAKAVGLSKAALYGYFSGKEQLFAAVIGNAPGFGFLDGLAEKPGDPEVVLRKIALEYLGMFRDPARLGLMRILLAEGGRDSALSAAFLRSAVGRGSALLGRYLSRLGFGPEVEMQKVAQAFIGMLFSWVVQHRVLIRTLPEQTKGSTASEGAGADMARGEGGEDSETEMAERAVRLFFYGLTGFGRSGSGEP